MSDENIEYRIGRLERLADGNRNLLEKLMFKVGMQGKIEKGLLALSVKNSEDFLFLMRLVENGINFKSEDDRIKLLKEIAAHETCNDQVAAAIGGLKSLPTEPHSPATPPAGDPPVGGS